MKQYFIVAILLVFFISCSEEKEKSVGLPISSTNTDAISFFNKAQIHDQNFEFNEAKDDYRSAIEIDPNFILAHINLLRQGNSNTNWIDLSNKNIDIIESLISNGTEYENRLSFKGFVSNLIKISII
jgi:tetratricopeptide (TPR) repeat protein